VPIDKVGSVKGIDIRWLNRGRVPRSFNLRFGWEKPVRIS
jgi:hypothetical protein